MSFSRSNLRTSMFPLLAPVAFSVLTACGNSERVDEQLRADLAAASTAPSARQGYVSPQELGYPQGYAPNYQPGYGAYAPGQYPAQYGYPQPVAAQAQPQTRVVYVPQRASTVRRSSGTSAGTNAGSGSGVYSGEVRQAEKRNTQKGAIIGAAAGAAIGVATARDKVKGGAIGALGGAVLGGVIGHQVKTPRN